ncbi:alpha/beta hydrolase family protein [Draconibacterium sp. IB214405]|uniref:alpha/beta hydrolase n=1 Tax=Draconibacterium sp. IB214405 TaxID=3097352 RepID=UPI002A0D291D|nr:alpha/beta hydrolase family protein [Draconibacterium sp. IB214405]MDX8337796.1 alpha/beta hydrolase family protein [Draconibacterium sp. IB214405]
MKQTLFLKTISLLIVITGLVSQTEAARVQHLTTHSQSMDKDIEAVVITPEGYSENNSYPVLYLLHGYSGNQNDWINGVPEIKDYADLYQFIIVCPDGAFSSWYFDSPIDNSIKYETYVAHELVNRVDDSFSTISSREGRAITGLSMGGHGALYLAFRNQDVYGAAGSMSGGVDIRPFPNNWDISKRLGTYAENKENWEENTVINLVYQLTPGSLKITIDCGVSDFFYGVNCDLHEKLLERNIPHDFTTRPGGHTWEYWENSIAFQSVFFHHFFEKVKGE